MYRNVLIVCVSVHHGNTLRITEAMNRELCRFYHPIDK